MPPDSPDSGPRRPRRRGASLEQAIIRAAVVELAEAGSAGFSVERVAERAGASKASLYRRWSGRADLLADVVCRLPADLAPTPSTGSLRSDALALLRSLRRHLAGPTGQALCGLLGGPGPIRPSVERARSHVQAVSRITMREIVRRAGERGERIRPDITDLQLGSGPELMVVRFATSAGPVGDELILRIVDEIVLPLVLQQPCSA